MKVSELMEEIIEVAEEKFGVSEHINDGIVVNVFYHAANADSDAGEDYVWSVALSRPTQNQLDRGETECEYIHTVKLEETRIDFHSNGKSLMVALRHLLDQVLDANKWDFQASSN